MLENGEIAEELLTVSEVAAALKVPVSWVYERTRRSGTDQEGCATAAWTWTWTERRAARAQGCLQRRPFI